MRRWWVYGMSFLITAFGIGSTLFFFMRTPTEEESVEGGTFVAEKPASPTLPVGKPDERFELAKQWKAQGQLNQARDMFRQLIESPEPVAMIDQVEKEYWDTNIKLLFSGGVEGWFQEVVVEKGDSLFLIADRFKTTVDLIKEPNHLTNEMIRPGQKLRVFTGQIAMVADKSLNTLTVKINGEVVKIYSVGTGVGGSTPIGDFTIANKLENPPWHHEGKVMPFGDSQNILGTRWMGFDFKGYGIHGTWDPSTVGSQSSAGCIRLRNEDVEELYKTVPVGTSVVVVE